MEESEKKKRRATWVQRCSSGDSYKLTRGKWLRAKWGKNPKNKSPVNGFAREQSTGLNERQIDRWELGRSVFRASPFISLQVHVETSRWGVLERRKIRQAIRLNRTDPHRDGVTTFRGISFEGISPNVVAWWKKTKRGITRLLASIKPVG